MSTAEETAWVELTARVFEDQGRFVATVDGLELEGRGSTLTAAQDALVQSMRGWLERQDTAGKLAESLGIEHLDEEAEIQLQFVVDEGTSGGQ
jgi:hypothetical protein